MRLHVTVQAIDWCSIERTESKRISIAIKGRDETTAGVRL
jgi:hypothetical protein